jgi:hypothetical protein
MSQNWQNPVERRIVSNETIPERLFACFADVDPSADSLFDLTIFTVGSVEMARQLRENDPFTQQGLFYDPDYFEWFIHMPFRKAPPDRCGVLKKLPEEVGPSPLF